MEIGRWKDVGRKSEGGRKCTDTVMRIWRRQGGVTPAADLIPKQTAAARNRLLYAGLRQDVRKVSQ